MQQTEIMLTAMATATGPVASATTWVAAAVTLEMAATQAVHRCSVTGLGSGAATLHLLQLALALQPAWQEAWQLLGAGVNQCLLGTQARSCRTA